MAGGWVPITAFIRYRPSLTGFDWTLCGSRRFSLTTDPDFRSNPRAKPPEVELQVAALLMVSSTSFLSSSNCNRMTSLMMDQHALPSYLLPIGPELRILEMQFLSPLSLIVNHVNYIFVRIVVLPMNAFITNPRALLSPLESPP